MDSGDSFQLIILIILLVLSAFFSSSETALMSVNKIRLRSLAESGNKRAALALDIVENKTSKMLSAILIDTEQKHKCARKKVDDENKRSQNDHKESDDRYKF